MVRIDYVSAEVAMLDLARLGVTELRVTDNDDGTWYYDHDGIRYVFMEGNKAYKEVPCTDE